MEFSSLSKASRSFRRTRIFTIRTVFAVTSNSSPTSTADWPSTTTLQNIFQSRCEIRSLTRLSLSASSRGTCDFDCDVAHEGSKKSMEGSSIRRRCASVPPDGCTGCFPVDRKWSVILLVVIRRSQPRNECPAWSWRKSGILRATLRKTSCTTFPESAG